MRRAAKKRAGYANQSARGAAPPAQQRRLIPVAVPDATTWESPEQRERAREAAHRHPPREGEGLAAYLERLATEAGLMSATDERVPGEEG